MDVYLENVWLADSAACHHGSRCSCRAFARALGLAESAIDFNYCRNVLQKHWGMSCDHLPAVATPRPNIQVPPHDSHDPVQMLLIANAARGGDEPYPIASLIPALSAGAPSALPEG